MARMVPLHGSSLCACYVVIEALLQLFRRVHQSGADVSPIAGMDILYILHTIYICVCVCVYIYVCVCV